MNDHAVFVPLPTLRAPLAYIVALLATALPTPVLGFPYGLRPGEDEQRHVPPFIVLSQVFAPQPGGLQLRSIMVYDSGTFSSFGPYGAGTFSSFDPYGADTFSSFDPYGAGTFSSFGPYGAGTFSSLGPSADGPHPPGPETAECPERFEGRTWQRTVPARQTDDEWIAFDKVQHLTFSFLWTLGTQYVVVNKGRFSERRALPISAASSALAGVAKELYDLKRGPPNTVSGKDLVADGAGILLAIGIILL